MKIISLMMAFLIFAGTIVYAQDTSLNNEVDLSEEIYTAGEYEIHIIDFLTKLGILPEEYSPEHKITRGEYINVLMRITSLSTGGSAKTVFTDVAEDYAYAQSIASAYDMGIISGYNDGTFRPEEIIITKDAKSAIAALIGYKNNELFNNNQTLTMRKNEVIRSLSKNISVSDNSELDGYTLAKIIYNSLDIPLFQKDVNGEKYFEDEDITLLSHYMGVKKYEGIVNANGATVIDGGSLCRENSIRIDNMLFSFDESVAASQFIGNAVKAYYKENANSRYNKLIAIYESDEQKSLRINTEDILSETTLLSVHYYDESGKEKKTSLNNNVKVVLNYSFIDEPTDDMLKPPNGYIELIDLSGDGRYDIVFVYDTEIYFVKYNKKSLGLIGDTYGKPVLDISGDDGADIRITKDGYPSEIKRIKIGSILEVTRNSDNSIINVEIFDNRIKGEIEEIGDNSLVINNQKFEVSHLAAEDFTKLKPGETVTLHLGQSGTVAGITCSSSDGMDYGYIITISNVKSALNDDKVNFLIYTMEGEEMNFKSADKIAYADYNYGEETTKYDGATLLSTMKKKDSWIHGLVRYELNENGEITKLIRPKRSTGNGLGYDDDSNFSLDYSFRTSGSNYLYYVTSGILGGRYMIGNAQCMSVPSDSDWELYYLGYRSLEEIKKSFNIFKPSLSWPNDYNVYDVDIYDADEHLNAGLVVSPMKGTGATTTSPEFFYVDELSNSLDEEGDARLKLNGIYKGEKAEYFITRDEGVFTSSPELLKLQRGDVIVISLNARSEVTNIIKLFTSHPETAQGRYILNAGQYDDFNSGDATLGYDNYGRVTGWNWNVINRLVHCKIEECSSTFVKVTLGRRNESAKYLPPRVITPKGDIKFVVYDEATDTLRLGSSADLRTDDPMQTTFIRIKYFVCMDVLIVNRKNLDGEIFWNGYYNE